MIGKLGGNRGLKNRVAGDYLVQKRDQYQKCPTENRQKPQPRVEQENAGNENRRPWNIENRA